MALLNIRKAPDEVLNKKCKTVVSFDGRLHILLDDMYETMKNASGLGLAAPQVGILKRVAVVDIDDKRIELINPEIIARSGNSEALDEGCLSFPGQAVKVKRPKGVTVRAQDRNGKEFTVSGQDLMARALCHEIDHTNGIVFTKRGEEGF